MNVAITIWNNRVSPVFDSSQTLLIAGIDGSIVTDRRIEPFDSEKPFRLAGRLKELDVGVLICGAISTQPAVVIESKGIQLIPFVCGNTDDVLESFARNHSVTPEFLLPGCGGKQTGRGNEKCGFQRQQQEGRSMPKGEGTSPRGIKPRSGNKGGRRGFGKAKDGSCKAIGQGVGGDQARTRKKRNNGDSMAMESEQIKGSIRK